MRYTLPPEVLTASLSSKLDSSLILLVNFRESDAFWKPVAAHLRCGNSIGVQCFYSFTGCST